MKSTLKVSNRWAVLLGSSLLALCSMPANAEEDHGITVSETGAAQAMPDTVELIATVEGNAELAGDAVEKYRGSKRRLADLLKGLNVKGLSIAGAGLSVNSGTPANPLAALQGQANQPKVADKVAVQERVTVTLSGINTMSPDDLLMTVTRIVDVVKDAGATLGPGPKSVMEIQFSGGKPGSLATFKLSNPDALRQQAYEAALKQARAKAERLAQLAGVELGEIISIRETAPISKDSNSGAAGYLALFGAAASRPPEFTSAEFQNIPVAVSLSVQFDITHKK